MNSRGVLISFEGIDASGKNTQSGLLHNWLKSKGTPTEYISFPDYETAIGKEIRSFLSGKSQLGIEARHILYSANRYEHKDKIERWLDDGKVVVINRYCESNIAYGVASGLPLDWLKEIESRMPQSDYVFFLKSTPELSQKRKFIRDKFETDATYLASVSKVYEALAEGENWFSIDADRTVELIHYEITQLVSNLLLESGAKVFTTR
jgi:dTMP kinase